MATMSISAPARTSNARIALRVVIALLVLALIVFLAFDVWFYRAVRAALPQVDGTIQVAGLTQPVMVTRDSLGIPTITATNLNDLFFAQGYVTAQERLWQMDMTRRYASGDLAVILGPDFVSVDRGQRILGLRQTAEKVVAAMDPVQHAQFQAYANGVNAYIAEHTKTLPMEFRFLTYAPHVWTVEDSLLVGLSMTEFLNHGYYKEILLKERALAKFGPELTAELFVNSSWRDHPPGSEGPSLESGPPGEVEPDEEESVPPPTKGSKPAPRKAAAPAHHSALLPFASPSLDAAPEVRFHPGSNDWVVSGAHTVSGKPLLSNDMHLQQAMPSLWYEAQLEITAAGSSAPPFNVAGFTLPGMPFVLIGHNQRIAWGATNLGADVEDLFIETFNAQGEYQTPESWKKPEVRHETIHVKGQPDVALDVVVTRHGPVISDVIPGETRKLALRWAPIKDPAFVSYPFFELDSAQNWEEFRRALSTMGGPSLNFVYADVDGHIGYQAEGRIPLRASPTNDVPVGGNDNAHEWTSVVPFYKLPSVFDPPSGIIATANARITPDKYPYPLSSEWMAPFRTERIYRVLQSGRQFAPEDMLALEMDVASEYDHFCAERFVYAVDHAKQPSARARAAADLMRSWDGQVTVESAAPTLAVGARPALWRMLLEPKLGADYKLYRWGMQSVALENILLRQPPRWLPAN